MEVPYAGTFLNYGVLGALTLILMLVSYTLFKLLIQEKDKRRDDAEKLSDGLMEPIKQIRENGETQITLLRQFLDKVKSV